jgi:uncharacterized protein (TIGR03000 family)
MRTPEQVPPPQKVGELKDQSGRAQLIVEVPTNAKLYVDDHLMNTTSQRRVFNTPVLQQGQTYYYIVRAEVDRDGMTYGSTQRVIIRPGDIIRTTFRDLGSVALQPLDGQITAQR